MRCPVCTDTELVDHIRDGIEVEQCPRCRGTWLDHRELEKLLDLAEARSPEPRITAVPDHSHPEPEPRPGRRERKRKGALAELLEEVFGVFD